MVQRRSRIESYGNAVFTLMFCGALKVGLTSPHRLCPRRPLVHVCDQCVSANTMNARPPLNLSVWTCRHACARVSQQDVTQRMNSFDSDKNIYQIMNDAARRYLTIFKNNFSMRMGAWQYRAIIADLRCC